VTDADLVEKKLALVETYIRELRSLGNAELIHTDVKERRFIEHTLQIAIQACLDVASHIVSDERLGEPENLRALFDLLKREGWLSADLTQKLGAAAGFRNIVVHGYAGVEPAIVEDVFENHLDDLLDFVAAIRNGLGQERKGM
jgi:uncharacterized protein YutE (UPF0331/DUF86 family)